MADHFDYGQKGVGGDVEHGSGGGRTIWDGSKFVDVENDGVTPARRQVADPVDPLDAVNFRTVDGLLDGILWKESVRMATAATLTSWGADGSGVGKRLAAPDELAANNDFDGVTSVLADRILVKDAVSAIDNGIYDVEQLASDSGAYVAGGAVLTFADADPDTIARDIGSFIADGFSPGDLIRVQGSASNDGVYLVDTVAALLITLDAAEALVAEGPTAHPDDTLVRPTVLKRSTDCDEDVNAAGEDEVRPGITAFVTEGATLAENKYTVFGAGPITVDTDAVNWTQSNAQPVIDPLIRVVVIGTGATQSLGDVLPTGARVQKVKLNVTTPYSGGASIEIRDDGPTTYMSTTENNPQKGGPPNLFISEQTGEVVVGGTRQLEAIVGGSPGAGAADVVVEYKL